LDKVKAEMKEVCAKIRKIMYVDEEAEAEASK
jgi:hypothetical protein